MNAASDDQKSPPSWAKVWRSEELFDGKREILIEHDSAHYRLIITKTGKLILNK